LPPVSASRRSQITLEDIDGAKLRCYVKSEKEGDVRAWFTGLMHEEQRSIPGGGKRFFSPSGRSGNYKYILLLQPYVPISQKHFMPKVQVFLSKLCTHLKLQYKP
jgi:hypothetical protein